MKKTILLTGATGFFGSHLLPTLIKKEYSIIILKRSFSNTWRIQNFLSQIKSYDIDKISLKKIFNENDIRGIIHLATDDGRKNNNDINKMVKANIELPTTLLDLGTKYGVIFFINTHTFADNKYNLYSATKSAFMEIARYFIANYQIKFINMRLEYMYGEKDNYSKLVPFAIKSILEGKEIKTTKGEQKRDFIYVEDVVDAYLKVLDRLENFGDEMIEFEIGTGESVSLKYFISKIEGKIGKKANIKWGEISYNKNEIFDSKPDIKKVEKILEWSPKYNISNGLKKTINWYKNLWKENQK